MIPLADIGLVLWLGILTSISPCPLATNIAAIAFLGRQIDRRVMAVISGFAYALGRATVYVILGYVLVSASQAIPKVSIFLQKNMSVILGPILIIVGLFLLNIFKFSGSKFLAHEKTQNSLSRKGWMGAFILGILFALSFCPVSAALFFGSTATLAVKHQSTILVPGLYGIGTALPVLLFSFIITYSMSALGRIFNKLTLFEKWARLISGCIFILAGFYLIIKLFF